MERPMSAIGSGSIGVFNIAGSIAGAQRNNATANEARAEAAEKSFQLDAATLTAQANGDISEPELSSERDADGRMPYEPERRTDEKEKVSELIEAGRRSTDLSGDLGNTLDLKV